MFDLVVFSFLQEDPGHLEAVLCLLQSDVDLDVCPLGDHSLDAPVLDPLVPPRPSWCHCGCCVSSSVHREELCCRRGDGVCITSSPLFRPLVLRRSLLEAILRYQDPLWAPAHAAAPLRHCAYRQYIRWRFGGGPPDDAHPVIPSCCVRQIRDEYPSPDGKYSGLKAGRGSPAYPRYPDLMEKQDAPKSDRNQ